MANPYLDWIWSQYSVPQSQERLSLRDSCTYFTKHILQPTDIILSGGGYVLHSNLAVPLANITSGLNHYLHLATQHHGFHKSLHIGHAELDILGATGQHATLATQSQIVLNWVFLVEKICAAKYQLKALCAGDVTHHSLRSWTSKINCIAASLPPVLRSKIPLDLVKRFNIKVDQPETKATAANKSLHAPVTTHASPVDIPPMTPSLHSPPSRAVGILDQKAIGFFLDC
ncbi:hypothetical protein R3P38DRAFT_3045269 [Favolaschia claudopus]|uniref:Uncharacterized protein n=1 Tax=Favolaschia claudopus TaxID=2862362 RepID=A0AAW0A6K1_9AGAR